MKRTELRTMIRAIVRDEVAMSINEVLTELKQPSLSSQQGSQQDKEKQHYSSNSVLNDVLNETANGEDWKTLGGKEFTTTRMNELVGKNYKDITDTAPSTDIVSSMGVDPNDPSMDFLKKDYKAVMKAVADKDKQKHSNK